MSRLSLPDSVRNTHGGKAPWLAMAGGVLFLLSGLLSWSYDDRILGDLSIRFYPAGIQLYAMLFGVIGLILAALLTRRPPWLSPARGLRILGVTGVVFVAWVIASVAYQAGGLINVNEGGWVALLGALLLTASGFLSPDVDIDVMAWPRLSSTLEILIIVVLMAVLLFTVAYTLDIQDGVIFASFLVALVGLVGGLLGTGFGGYLGFIGQNNRRPLLLAAFLVAFLFPFTQDGSDANMSIATQILIFAATALGLNIVVGLAGLLDLGYIAFLGTGAYVAAMLSTSTFATIGWKPPFAVVMLIGAATAATFGLIIGTPTLRVSGDYLAIVTLGFGEIFRLAMFNLDGNNGPPLTNGPNGIPAIPDLEFLGFDFGEVHTVAGIPLGRFSNYYFMLLLLLMFVILVFTRLNDSRIGRGWVAIREDERAAEAMGVNTFGLKLLAFSVGAFLAGLAGTIKAHQDTSVSPDQYIFLESAFLLSAVVLGGMGTVLGVLVGATILKLLPEKLREVNDYRLLVFGLLLIVMMRFRPEGLVPSKRRQLEFHEDDQELSELLQAEHLQEGEMTVTETPDNAPGTSHQLVLEASGVTMRFGGLTAVDDVSMKVHEGEIVGLIGPNGAGKTTFFNCLTGMYIPTEGRVELNGQTLPPKPLKVVKAGMARTFQNIRLFANMTALENVMVGRYCRTSSMAITSILRGPKFKREEAATRERAQELLDYVGLGRSTELLARNMPYGDQRRLEIARALATDPQILLLDEPTAGMNPKETEETMHLIRKIRDGGLAVVVIEHDMRFIFNLCDRVLCLVRGSLLVEGTPGEVQSDHRVIEAYIGGDDEEESA